ncbi:L-lactate MFS transporter [Enterococcus quebecensis]|uniref:MFS transporter n=1 Tax=Enterococcus quebecensis TaxID=903983 RepID=A0A1E5GRM0_9ENTE|nr:OFA family MFS transporter [Enterococcus quebecensis]OEG15319.1 MFS transporter [Enterococcus quebecensis]
MSIEKKLPKVNRWAILFASVGIIFCQGGIYAFSVFATPIAKAHGWDVADVMIAFTIAISISPIPMVIGGRISDKGKSKELILFSSMLLAAAFILTGFVTTKWMLYLTYGVLGGFGLNLGYIACINNAIRFFPDKKGLCSGLVITGIGLGTTVFAPLSAWMIERFDIKMTFVVLGIVYAGISLVCSLIIQNAPIEEESEQLENSSTEKNYTWRQMIKHPLFYIIVLMYAAGGFSGLMISSNAADIGQNMFELTPIVAATFVSVYALSNCLGRVIWGGLSDKINRTNTMMLIFACISLSLLAFIFLHSVVGFAVGMIGLGLCEGGVAAVMPPITIESFGNKNQGVNYSFVFAGYSIASMVAPRLSAMIGENNNGNFTQAFIIGLALAIAGIIFTFIYKKLKSTQVLT